MIHFLPKIEYAMTIDRDSPVPLYYQLKQWLSEQITGGTYKPGDMLPTEQQLQQEFGLSRTTVRQTLRELEVDGLVIRYRGRGTFVSKPKLSHSPEPRYSLSNFLKDQGMRPGWQVLTAEHTPAPLEVARELKIKPKTQVFCLRRIRLANDEAIGYHRAYVSPDFAEAIDETAFSTGGSLRYLNGRGHLEGSYADRILEAVPANDEEARLLRIEKGAPILLIQRVVISKTERPIEFFKGVYRGDRFQYQIRRLTAINPINA